MKDMTNVIEDVFKFHTKRAPGIVIGVYMVDLAYELFDPKKEKKLNAISETTVCLIDAIQYMTGMTVGNKYIRLIHTAGDIGRYALSFFDREKKDGVRVYLDINKIDRDKYPYLYSFYTRTRDLSNISRKEHNKKVIEDFLKGQENFLSYEFIKVDLPEKEEMGPSILCEKCNELFLPKGDEKVCLNCVSPYYTVIEKIYE